MGRVKKTEYNIAGRPPKDPLQKVGQPVRALVTMPMMAAIEAVMKESDMTLSEFLRLAMFRELDHRGVFDANPELRNDMTWSTLKEKGLI